MKGREELFSFKIPAPSGPGAKIGRPRPSTTATPRKFPLHSHSAFKPFARYSDRLLAFSAPNRDREGAGLTRMEAVEKDGVLIKPKRIVDPDDTLSPAEAKIVRRGVAQLKRGESKPWRVVKH